MTKLRTTLDIINHTMNSMHLHIFFIITKIFIITNLLFASHRYTPQIGNPLLEPWRYTVYSELKNKGVECMAEGKNGSIWFGLQKGIIHYDGINYRHYTQADGILGNRVRGICLDKDSTVYIVTESGVSRFLEDKWQQIFSFPTNVRGYTVVSVSDSSILVGTREGVLRIKDNRIQFFTVAAIAEELKVYPPSIEVCVTQNEGLNHLGEFSIREIFEDHHGQIWMTVNDRFIIRTVFEVNYDNSMQWKTGRVDDFQSLGYKQDFIEIDGKEILMVNDNPNHGLFKYNGTYWSEFPLVDIGGNQNNVSICQTRDGAIWIGEQGGFHIFKDDRWRVYQTPEIPISASSRIKLMEASDGSVWFACLLNVVVRLSYTNSNWMTYEGLLMQCESREGTTWFLSQNGQAISRDSTKETWLAYGVEDGLIDTPVALFITRKNELWAVGSHQGSAATALFKEDRWIKKIHHHFSWGVDYRSICEGPDGSVYFASGPHQTETQGGILKYKKTILGQPEWTTISLPRETVNCTGLAFTSDGLLWFGGPALFHYDEQTLTMIEDPQELSDDWIDDVYSPDGRQLWVSKGGIGLFHYNGRQWRKYTVYDGLASNIVSCMLSTDGKTLYAGTPQGISYFDGQNWTSLALHSEFHIEREGGTIITTKKGNICFNLASREWYLRELLKIPEGQIKPVKTICYVPDKLAPETRILDSSVGVRQPGNAILSWQGMDAWKMTPDDQLQFSYRLDDGEWSSFSLEKQKIYLSLNYGNHSFEVRARDLNFNVDPTPASVQFYVIPPVYRQSWFIALISLFLSIIISLVVYIIRRNMLITQLELEKEKKSHELDRLKLQFFTNLSHEIRTPLTLILAPLQSLITKGKSNQYLQYIYSNAKKLTRLIDQLLDFQKIESGQIQLNLLFGDVVGFLEERVEYFRPQASNRQIAIEFKTQKSEILCCFDSDKLETVVNNLIMNALKFTSAGGEIVVEARITKDEEIEISIADTGRGIPRQEMDHIFDSFYQVNTSAKTKNYGVGIGLSLVKRLVELHHGHIAVESQLEKGTCFTITLPSIHEKIGSDRGEEQTQFDSTKSIGEIHEEIEEEPPGVEIRPSGKKPLVLIVEDNTELRSFIKSELQSAYRIVEAEDGLEGLEIAKNDMPDLIISDIMMPGVDGVELTKKLKTELLTSHIPIILLTAKRSVEHELEGLEAHADDYITKPFNMDVLHLRIHNLIESRRKFKERFIREIHLQPIDIEYSSLDQQFLQKVIDIIQRHLEEPEFNIETLSKKIGMSRRSFYNKIKSLTGLKPNEFLRLIRLKKAAQFLKESQLTVSEICYTVGFNDMSRFFKYFKHQFGMSPNTFRKTDEG